MENADDGARVQYVHDVKNWSMLMLSVLKELPNTPQKITLLTQLDKVKDASKLEAEELPAYAGALAILSSKARRMARGEDIEAGYSKDSVIKMFQSKVLKKAFATKPDQFTHLKEFLDVKRKETLSDTLVRLSRSGH